MAKTLYEIKLEQRKKKSKKDTLITDMDYVLRDKEEERKKGNNKNWIDMTPKGNPKADTYEPKYAEEIAKLKEDLKKSQEDQVAQEAKDKEVADLKAQVQALMELMNTKVPTEATAEETPAPKAPTKAK